MGILLLGITCRHRLIDEMNTIWGMMRSFSSVTSKGSLQKKKKSMTFVTPASDPSPPVTNKKTFLGTSGKEIFFRFPT